jgi:hypothetical protein
MVAPVVTSVNPNAGPPSGGTSVTITGSGFTGATSVRFGGQPATNIVVVSDTSITAKTPAAQEQGQVAIAVTTPGGTGASTPIFNYTGVFPAFIPILPPPLISNPPPPTFPPTGGAHTPVAVPVGPLVGPAIAPAPVPPSLAGVTQPIFKTGSATSPTAASWIPQFTTTFPVPTIVVDGFNGATVNAGHTPPWTWAPPAQTPSTAPIH